MIKKPNPVQALTCEGGLRFFQKDGYWGFRDQSGRTIIEPRFRALSCFQQGVSWAVRRGDDRWCPIGPSGARHDALGCHATYYPYRATHHYPERLDDDPFESSVLWTRAWLDYQAGKSKEPPRWISDGVMGDAIYSVGPGGPGGPGWVGEPIGSSQFSVRTDYWLILIGAGTMLLAMFGFVVRRWRM